MYRGVTPNPEAIDFNPEPPIFACHFCPLKGLEQILALANEDGNIALQDTTKKGQPNEQLQGSAVRIYLKKYVYIFYTWIPLTINFSFRLIEMQFSI